MMKRAYSIVEIAVALTLVGLLTANAFRLGFKIHDQLQLTRFAGMLASDFALARRFALLSGQTVEIDFSNRQDHYVMTRKNPAAGGVILRQKKKRGESFSQSVLDGGMPHPTVNRSITEALSSTHQNRILFKGRGSSSATLVFSDGEKQAVCVVVSSFSGRFQIFVWDAVEEAWLPFH